MHSRNSDSLYFENTLVISWTIINKSPRENNSDALSLFDYVSEYESDDTCEGGFRMTTWSAAWISSDPRRISGSYFELESYGLTGKVHVFSADKNNPEELFDTMKKVYGDIKDPCHSPYVSCIIAACHVHLRPPSNVYYVDCS